MENVRVVFVSIPTDEADNIAKKLVEKRLAACVNIVPKIKSFYWWEDKVMSDDESLLIIKTAQLKVEQLTDFVRNNHPYEVPEVIAFKLSEGLPDYINWIMEETGK